MLDLQPQLQSKHILATEGPGDEYSKSALSFNLNTLSQLLFCDLYAIERMSVEGNILHLYVRHSGPCTPLGQERILGWDTQQFASGGVVNFSIVCIDEGHQEGR
jgi:hypothetical protein